MKYVPFSVCPTRRSTVSSLGGSGTSRDPHVPQKSAPGVPSLLQVGQVDIMRVHKPSATGVLLAAGALRGGPSTASRTRPAQGRTNGGRRPPLAVSAAGTPAPGGVGSGAALGRASW